MFEIKKNVPMPSRAVGRLPVYNFAAMEIGDCFFAPDDMGKTKSQGSVRQRAISSTANAYAKKHNPTAKFITRTMPDATIGCWRIA